MRVPFHLRLNSDSAYVPLKREDDAGLIPEITLVIVAMSEGVAKAREYLINFCYPNGDGLVNRDVETPSNEKVKGVIARAFRDDAFRTILNQIPGNIRMGAAKHGFQKWPCGVRNLNTEPTLYVDRLAWTLPVQGGVGHIAALTEKSKCLV
jgi:hypothetical protein